jgi:4-hydroxy-tetrahydrodipicolinate synthase
MSKARPALGGVIPAHLLPFTADLEIDEPNLRRHLRALLAVDGITGLTTTAHASEIATLTTDERREVLDIVVDECRGGVPVIAGVYEDGTAKAARWAAEAELRGADALLLFPSAVYDGGAHLRPEMALRHVSEVAEATSLPVIVFVYPTTSGLRIPTDTLVRICDEVDNVVAVKEWSNDIVAYERNLRALHGLDKPIAVLSSFSRSLLASLCLGADGVLSGHGSVVADVHVRLFTAVQNGDLEEARALWERIQPFAEVCYADPFLDGHSRMKYALTLLGVIDEYHMRPPLQPIPEHERRAIAAALALTGLSPAERAPAEVR